MRKDHPASSVTVLLSRDRTAPTAPGAALGGAARPGREEAGDPAESGKRLLQGCACSALGEGDERLAGVGGSVHKWEMEVAGTGRKAGLSRKVLGTKERGGVSGGGIWLDSGIHRLPLVATRGTDCGGSHGHWKARKGLIRLVCVGDDFF